MTDQDLMAPLGTVQLQCKAKKKAKEKNPTIYSLNWMRDLPITVLI